MYMGNSLNLQFTQAGFPEIESVILQLQGCLCQWVICVISPLNCKQYNKNWAGARRNLLDLDFNEGSQSDWDRKQTLTEAYLLQSDRSVPIAGLVSKSYYPAELIVKRADRSCKCRWRRAESKVVADCLPWLWTLSGEQVPQLTDVSSINKQRQSVAAENFSILVAVCGF